MGGLFGSCDRKWMFGLVAVAGIAVGVAGWIGFDAALHKTTELEFCVSCHEMRDTVYKEYMASPHYANGSGVRAICADCHVAKDLGPKLVGKAMAARELWHSFLGTIDTPEKFEAERLHMAKRVWATMKATDSRECRSCHSFEAMDPHKQTPKAVEQMQKGQKDGQTCIDCHKGIAHKLPDMTSGFRAVFDELTTEARGFAPKPGDSVHVLKTSAFALDRPTGAEIATPDGKILPLTTVKVLERAGDWVRVRAEGWQQEGAEKMLYAVQGKRIFAVTLGEDAIAKLEPGAKMTDPDTDQVWTPAGLPVWVAGASLVADRAKLFAYGAEMYASSCGLCHSAPPTDHYLANQWIGTLNAMKRFVSLDDEQYRFLQKYVQLNAQDTGGHHE